MREAKEDWLELGRDLTSRGLAAPRLIEPDGAPGLISAVEELWPRAEKRVSRGARQRLLLVLGADSFFVIAGGLRGQESTGDVCPGG